MLPRVLPVAARVLPRELSSCVLPRTLCAAAHVLLFACCRAVARVFSCNIATPDLCCYAPSVSRVVSMHCRFTRAWVHVAARVSPGLKLRMLPRVLPVSARVWAWGRTSCLLPRLLSLVLLAVVHVSLFVCCRAVARVFSCNIATPDLCCYAPSVSRVMSLHCRFKRAWVHVAARVLPRLKQRMIPRVLSGAAR